MGTIQEYYEGNDHGNYQFVSFNSLVEDMVEETLDGDSYLKNTKRSQIIKWLKKGVREMNFNALNRPKFLEFTLPPSLSMVMPVDYVDWVRIWVIGDDGFLYTLGNNKNMNIAEAFLQDDNYEILFDNDGNPLKADSADNIFGAPFKRRILAPSCRGNMKNIDTSAYSTNGEFNVDKENGRIGFSSNLSEQTIVLQYISDSLEDEKIFNGDLKINKYAIDAIHDYAYWQIIRKKRTVNAGEKQLARREYFNSRRKTKMRISNIKVNDILKAVTSATKWI